MAWQNRIVALEEHRPSDLADHPRQWRTHDAHQRAAIRGVLAEVGIADALLVYVGDGSLFPELMGKLVAIDGHLRKSLDQDVNWPCLLLDVTDEEAVKLLATFDPLAAMAGSDAKILADLLEQVSTEDDAVQRLLDEIAAEAGIELGEPLEDPGARVSEADALAEKWGTCVGQCWAMGGHRLVIGGSTDSAVVEAVMGSNERYDLLVTDPPYGVSYADKNKFLNAIAPGNRIQTPIEGDHKTPGEMSHFWRTAFSVIREYARPGACYYTTGPQGGDLLLLLLLALRDSGFPLRHMLIWAKNNHVLGRCDYNYKHEPIIYGWVEGAGHRFYGAAGETSLWEIPKPQKSKLHPTMKPVELFERAIWNSTLRDEVVFDPFLGSGTTIIACERLGRKCRAIELDPGYCAVAIQRWVDMTGGDPRLLA